MKRCSLCTRILTPGEISPDWQRFLSPMSMLTMVNSYSTQQLLAFLRPSFPAGMHSLNDEFILIVFEFYEFYEIYLAP